MMHARTVLVAGLLAVVVPLAASRADERGRRGRFSEHAAGIRGTKHNLSASGPGEIRAASERRICVFCHTTHAAAPRGPLWNRRDSGRAYRRYWSPTLDAYKPEDAPEVEGASRLCLSCHDGTVAIGDIRSGGPIRMRPNVERVPKKPGLSSRDLSGSHPVSFQVTEDLISRNNAKDTPLKPLAEMRSDPSVKLDRSNHMQCTTCHDPHNNKYGATSGVPFWRKPTWEGVCEVCHVF